MQNRVRTSAFSILRIRLAFGVFWQPIGSFASDSRVLERDETEGRERRRRSIELHFAVSVCSPRSIDNYYEPYNTT